MNRSQVVFWSLVVAVLGTVAMVGEVQAQCRGGGGGSAGGGQRSSGASMASASSGGTMLTSPGSWAYDQMLGQAIQRQIAQQRYQQALAEQQQRAENLARRQYWAAQRREQKAKSVSPGELAAKRAPSNSMAMSLEFTPSSR